jgi:hypothetical protein
MRQWVGLIALLAATHANADQTIFGPTRNGIQVVCADVNELQATADDLIGTWILGFWSGLNAAKNARVGDVTTSSGVVGEVRLYCSSHPSVTLPQATLDTYTGMRGSRNK